MLLVNLSYCALQPDAPSSQGSAGGGQHRRFLSAILNGALGKEQVLYCPQESDGLFNKKNTQLWGPGFLSSVFYPCVWLS